MSESDISDIGKTYAPLAEVATAYGVSVDTIRRRLKRGELEGRRETTPQGFRWLAAMPDASGSPHRDDKRNHDSDIVIVQRDRDLVETLQHELEIRNQEIARLHDVVAAQARAFEQATTAFLALPETPLTSRTTSSEVAESPQSDEGPLPGIRAWLRGLLGG